MEPLPVFKALGDDTRFAIYQELGRSPAPLSASELAERLSLHPNTVRPHLDRMREAGLVEVEPIHRGTVGRPQLRYSLAPGAPGLGFDPPAHTLLAGLLAALAEQLGRRRARRRQPRAALGHRCHRSAPERPGLPGGPGGRTRPARVRPGGVGARRWRRSDAPGAGRLPPLPLPRAGRGLSGDGLQPAPRDRRGRGGQQRPCGRPAGMVEDFRTLIDRDPCCVTVSVGYPESDS